MTSADAPRPTLDRSGSRIDHLNLAVPDLAVAVAFYEPVLASIGITKMLEIPAIAAQDFPAMTGFGLADVKPYFWLVDHGTVGTNMHLAFTVDTRELVDTFHAAALAAGATPREAPAIHPQYHDDYYGGFVDEPHGVNLEAVCHHPQEVGPAGPCRRSGVDAGPTARSSGSTRRPRSDASSRVAHHGDMPASAEQQLMYQAVVSRRLQFDNLVWQVPVLSLTAQAFLFTVALSSDATSWARIVASLLSLIISVLSILLMARHRQGELTDAHWLARFEQEVLDAGKWGAHGPAFRSARDFEGLDAGWVGRLVPLRPMFAIWVVGLGLFGLAALVIIAAMLVRSLV